MLRMWIILAVLFVATWATYAYLVRDPVVEDRSGIDMLGPAWPPTSADLVRQVGANGKDSDTPEGKAARQRFTYLFKKRYREHDPQMAMGIRFKPGALVDVLFPPRMEPWTMDRLAVHTWHETQQAFGHPFNIDLYITYIGVPPLKIGELRPQVSDPTKLQIVHFAKPIAMMPGGGKATVTTQINP